MRVIQLTMIGLAVVLAQTGNLQASMIIFASEDSGASDFQDDGVFDILRPGQLVAARFSSGEEQRFSLEFNIASLSVVDDATLHLIEIRDDGADVDLYGYVGDGTIQLTDMGNANLTNLIASDVGDGIVNTNTIDVTGFVQGLVGNSETFAGFSFVSTSGPQYRVAPSNSSISFRPFLVINASAIPEPSGLLLFGASVFLIAGRRRSS